MSDRLEDQIRDCFLVVDEEQGAVDIADVQRRGTDDRSGRCDRRLAPQTADAWPGFDERADVSAPSLWARLKRPLVGTALGLAVAVPVAVGLFLILSSSNTEPDMGVGGGSLPASSPSVSGPSEIAPPAASASGETGQPGSELGPEQVVALPRAPIEGRIGPVGVWTGEEMLVWGGSQPRPAGGEDPLADGAAYEPRTDTWRVLSPAPIRGRAYASAAWTGDELVIWGGGADGALLDDGAAYQPQSDTWRTLAPSPLKGAMKSGAVWTGSELLIVGGLNGDSSAAAYDPATDTWRSLPDAPGLITPPYPQAVWTGREAFFLLGVVAAATEGGRPLGELTLASYDPAQDRWQIVPHQFANSLPFLVWTGEEIVGMTTAPGVPVRAYAPATGQWRELDPLPDTVDRKVAFSTPPAWTGREVLAWSGGATGLALDPANNAWRNFPAGNLGTRIDGALVWADGTLLGWGGFLSQPDGSAIGAGDGIAYTPPTASRAVAKDSTGAAPLRPTVADETQARTVATAAGIDLVALPGKPDGYCLRTSTQTQPILGTSCTDGNTGADADDESLVIVFANAPAHGQQAMIVAGRVVDPNAATVSIAGIDAALTKDGFFAFEIPQQRWEEVTGRLFPLTLAERRSGGYTVKSHNLVVSDAEGATVVEQCVRIIFSPADVASAGEGATGSTGETFVSPESAPCTA